MKEFKFDCPACGQPILAEDGWSGRRINCPSCHTEILIPSPPVEEQKQTGAALEPAASQERAGAERKAEPVPDHSDVGAAQAAPEIMSPQTAAPEKGETASPARPPTESTVGDVHAQPARVAVLTPEVKLEMVRAVRQRIANEGCWVRGVQEGKRVYAAKDEGEKLVPVDVESPDATRFTLVGAFLLELHQRNVASTASGRRRLLDQEIPKAIQDALLEELSDEERDDKQESVARMDRMSLLAISHAQCLAALNLLEERYSQRVDEREAEKFKGKLANVRLSDLVRNLEKKARISPEDVAAAMYHELTHLRRRVERLESRMAEPDAPRRTGSRARSQV